MPKILGYFTRAFTGVNFRPNFDKRSGVMMPGSRKLSKVGGGDPPSRPGKVQIQGISFFFFFFFGGGEGVELRGSGPQVPNPGLCMVIMLKIFKMKDCMRCIMRKIFLHM